ncbi:MAG: hypothetical protein GEU71_13410 [Actinobacteria bacterium]|nr:hypothetical protein [Actinomycetota bacterium]
MLRRKFVVALCALLLLGACAEGERPSVAREDLVFVRSDSGLAVLQVAGGGAGTLYARDGGVPTADWSTVISADSQEVAGTHLVALDPASREERWSLDVPGNHGVTVVSHDGNAAALSPYRQLHYSEGRARTRLIVANGETGEMKDFDLAGNFEPEAFSTDLSSLFVISFTPPKAPKHYQVRRLDLASGKVEDVFTPHGELQGTMGGSSRVQTANPDGTRLYTLYTVPGGKHGEDKAFVHVLDLQQQWAHCIDLPAEFYPSAGRATAITSAPDGRVFVVNAKTGALAELDPVGLSVGRSTTIEMPFGSSWSSAAADGETLYIARGTEAIAVAISTLAVEDRWTLDEKITGLQITPDGELLYLGLSNDLARLEIATGDIETIAPSGIGKIRRFGPAPESVAIGNFTCAC